MGPKGKKLDDKLSTVTTASSSYTDPPRFVNFTVRLEGDPGAEFIFLTILDGAIVFEGKWADDAEFEMETMPLNLNDPGIQALILSNPIIFLLRAIVAKSGKQDPDPLFHTDNRAGGTVDLLPLLIGEEEVFTTVHLVSINTGEFIGCQVTVHAVSPGKMATKLIPLQLTMISANCMPLAKEGTDYISAIGLTDLVKPHGLQFYQTLSSPEAKKVVWATASRIGQSANTAFSIPEEDHFIPPDLEIKPNRHCRSLYWNALNRVLVEPDELLARLSSPFLIDVAGVPKVGKQETRGHFIGWVDAGVLLIPGTFSVTVCTKLFLYNEIQGEQGGGGILNLPPSSAKGVSARENEAVLDESGHNAYVVIRFDLIEPIVPKTTLDYLYDSIGFSPPVGPGWAIETLDIEEKPYDPFVDVGVMRRESGALKVHRELSKLTCIGGVHIPMQSIKRTAAHRLLTRIRTMIKNFPPGDCSYIDWQDTVTGQHAASRRAVTASFAPQPPRPRLPERVAPARARIAGDDRLAEKYVQMNLKVAGSHPRSLICKILRCLEDRNDLDAKNYLLEALNSSTRNRFLLWILGAQEFDKGEEEAIIARNAFQIAVKGDNSDGTINAIAYAGLHAIYHAIGNMYGAHISARKMRKCYKLPNEWAKVLNRWSETSGEEEVFWTPTVISTENPMLIAAAMFLCLRCYKLCERILECVERNCATRGSNISHHPQCADVYYLKSALFILRRQLDRAMDVTQQGIKKFGPSPLMSQMRLTCLSCLNKWDSECEKAFKEAEKAGSTPCPSVLYKAAFNRFKIDPKESLQRAALVHKLAPSGHTALLLGRIYAKLGEDDLAERWCAVAVKLEPLLADAWAMLALLAMYQMEFDKARTMLRTAKQAGPISSDIDKNLKKVTAMVQLDLLPDSLVKNLCMESKFD
ncbi:unnamed protein product [Arctia plantaginis]|uniref:Uncharacterized protein n=1 Tax=Arctia plantaginis TaxID=874455 RepID=A0A8S0ZNI0_ARCPL|nr:unnamed protein product [Arctia plantaginis]